MANHSAHQPVRRPAHRLTPPVPPRPVPRRPVPRPPQPDTAPVALAVLSVLLGVIGLIGAWWPLLRNLTVLAAALGFLLGLFGIWLSRQIWSGVGVVACGSAVILSVALGAMQNPPHAGTPDLVRPVPAVVEVSMNSCGVL